MKTTVLFNDSMQISFPDDFTDMPGEMLQAMFPDETRPQVIVGSSDTSFIALNLFDKSLTKPQLYVASQSALSLLERFYPQCHDRTVHIITLENSICGWFDFSFQSKVIILFIIAIDGKMLQGSCGCAEADIERMEELKKSFMSIKCYTDMGKRQNA